MAATADVMIGLNGVNILLGGDGIDLISSTGFGDDIVLGDNGNATFDTTSGKPIVRSITTTNSDVGGADVINVADGNNIVFGGVGSDEVTAGMGNDIVVGDSGNATFGETGILLEISTMDSSIGAGDTLTAGTGNNVIIGGAGADQITTVAGNDIILGDSGRATFYADGVLSFITTLDAAVGAVDTILAGNGSNVIFGGADADLITGGLEQDVVLGDSGFATFATNSVLIRIESSDNSIGGDDVILVSEGDNIIIGGIGTDRVTGGDDRDVVLGDNGRAIFLDTGILILIESTTPEIGSTDILTLGTGNNFAIAGAGKDEITGGSGDDVIVGDNGRATFTDLGIISFITSIAPMVGDDDEIIVNDGFNVVIGGIGADHVTGGTGRDVMLGDNGNATFDTAGLLTLIQTSDATLAGRYDDVLLGNSGSDYILGGNGNDLITAGPDTDDDVVMGDNGRVILDTSSGQSIIRDILSTDTGIGGNDVITAGDGFNTVVGGFGEDTITLGSGTDVVLGDNGQALFNAKGILTYITTIDPTIGGVDIIQAGTGFNTVFGGAMGDQVTGDTGTDVVMGDHGNATFTDEGVLIHIISTDTDLGGDDLIITGSGFNAVFGGFGADNITGGADRDVIAGDSGEGLFTTTGVLVYLTTISPAIGGDDTIVAGEGDNTVLGGAGKDSVLGGDERDIVVGDNGNVTFNSEGYLIKITTSDPAIGDDDLILVGNGFNVVFGGIGADQITGGADRDIVVGDNGNALFDALSILTFIRTSDAAVPGSYNDLILLGEGHNVAMGGNGNDQITSLDGDDIVGGDNGRITFDSTGGESIIRSFVSTDVTIGGEDLLQVGAGDNIIVGGTTRDRIISLGGNDIASGDSAQAVFNAAGILTYIVTLRPDVGADDVIEVGGGNNIVIGGSGADDITSLGGNDVVIGDNGSATFTDVGVLVLATTLDPTFGGNDVIQAGDGNNVILGGIGNDRITGGTGDDIVVGDNGNAHFDSTGVVLLVQTSHASIPGSYNDVIQLAGGDNIAFGGNGNDTINSDAGDDILFGDNGLARFDNVGGTNVVREITSTDPSFGGDDTLEAGEGKNIVIGGNGQ